MTWGTPEERERRLRIRVAAAAYAYEVESRPVMSDETFDKIAEAIDPTITTGHPVLDEFFIAVFQPYTGSWIHIHPDLDGVRRACAKMRRYMETT